MNILLEVQAAFSNRKYPVKLIGSEQLSHDENAEVSAFSGKEWLDLTCGLLEENRDAIFWFSPEAFCYFLPGIISAGVREGRPDIYVNHSLINMLDMSPDPSGWDDFFLERWGTLNSQECEVVQKWILWLGDSEEPFVYENTLERAFDTVELLKQRKQES